MNKKLIVINGTMGVGKSSVVLKLNKELKKSILLDGDWCWMMNSWKVTEENKKMVNENITFLLKQFLKNNSFNRGVAMFLSLKIKDFGIIKAERRKTLCPNKHQNLILNG